MTFHELRADDGVVVVIRSLYQNIGTDRFNLCDGRRVMKNRDVIDGLQARQYCRSRLDRINGPTLTFERERWNRC